MRATASRLGRPPKPDRVRPDRRGEHGPGREGPQSGQQRVSRRLSSPSPRLLGGGPSSGAAVPAPIRVQDPDPVLPELVQLSADRASVVGAELTDRPLEMEEPVASAEYRRRGGLES